MIVAPDVIARTVDPEDFLRYLTAQLSSAFVQSRDVLDARLAGFDRRPDPDCRYRINEFCCRDDTWQATVIELMRRVDAVVMDVRGVTAKRRGCEFELQQLAARLLPEQIVLVVDGMTDRGMIEGAMLGHGAARLPKIDRSGPQRNQRNQSSIREFNYRRVWGSIVIFKNPSLHDHDGISTEKLD